MSTVALAIVVPTYKEAPNLPHLVAAIAQQMQSHQIDYQIIIADDSSNDGTIEICEQLSSQYPIKLLTRTANFGLSPAVIDGIEASQSEVVIVMDADLSHPASKLPEIFSLISSSQYDFVVGSRYIKGGSLDESWSWFRRLNSKVATYLALPLCTISDPMSGFFGFRRSNMPSAQSLSPLGYKIGLEILVKGSYSRKKVQEVPIHFTDRLHGESKLNIKEQINYLFHLNRLYLYKLPRLWPLFLFCLVGTTGLAIDLATFNLLLLAGTNHIYARIISFFPAVCSNWYLNRKLTFINASKAEPISQLFKFIGSGLISFAINLATYSYLTLRTELFAEHYSLALIVAVIIATICNFLLAKHIVFRTSKQ